MRPRSEAGARPSAFAPPRPAIMAAFGALALFFSVVEQFVPKPAFFRIGLSNIPLLLALDFMPFGSLALLSALKVAGQGLLTGTLASYVFLFSAAGSAASLLSMYALKRLLGERMSLIGIGTAGALASNAAQALLSVAFIFGPQAVLLVPFLLGAGTATGIAMGAFAEGFKARSSWLAAVKAAWKGEDN
jgi:heptaprenyl diphosphate synthase